MTIAFYSAKSYDKTYFDKSNTAHKINYLDVPLNEQTYGLAAGNDVVCLFVNDHANAKTIEKLAGMGIKLIALRCAGFNNVDLEVEKY